MSTHYNTAVSLHFSPVPKDRDKFYFKLRQGVQKKVVLSVQQMGNKELGIERYVQDAHNSHSFIFLLFFHNIYSKSIHVLFEINTFKKNNQTFQPS